MTFPKAAIVSGTTPQATAATEQSTEVMEQSAFQIFYQRTAPALRSYIRRSLGNDDTADDILQEAYLRYLRNAPRGLEETARKPYLYRIASNLIVDHWRRFDREQRWNWRDFLQRQRKPAKLAETRGDVSRIFQTLKPQQRALLWLAYVEGFEHREIAAALGLQEKSVRVLLFRARQKMAALLEESGFHGKRRT